MNMNICLMFSPLFRAVPSSSRPSCPGRAVWNINTVLQRVSRGMKTLLTDSNALQKSHKGCNIGEFLCVYLFNDVINSYGYVAPTLGHGVEILAV